MLISFLFYLFFILYICASAVLILVVLVQSGKGGGLSGLVGAGSALGDHLGATGAEKTLNRWTSYCAIGFLLLNIFLVLIGPRVFKGSILDTLQETKTPQQSGKAAPSSSLPPAAGGPVEQKPQPVPGSPAGAPAESTALFPPVPAGIPAAGTPAATIPAAGTPATGIPAAGTPARSMPAQPVVPSPAGGPGQKAP